MRTPEKVIDIACGETGYLEKASLRDLDDKKANAGDKNYTKFARDIDGIPGFFKGGKQGKPWCAVFVAWCFVKAYGEGEAKRMLCLPDDSYGASCKWAAKYYKDKGRFRESDPQAGDQIFFQKSGRIVHTGIVTAVRERAVYTVEGNTKGKSGVVDNGGEVCEKSYSVNYAGIYGYGRPIYDTEDGKVTLTVDKLKKGSRGDQVRSVQQLLSANGYPLYIDGEFGDKTDDAVRKYQKDKGLYVDGIIGIKTWSRLLGC